MSVVPLVFRNGPWRMQMGLSALDPSTWIQIDEHYDAEIEQRRQLLEERREAVHAALPEARDGAEETLAMLIAHLPATFPERFEAIQGGVRVRSNGRAVTGETAEPLLVAGLLVQEDLCLMQGSPEGYRLVGATLCFPSHWRLADKLGLPMRDIHDPVPGFNEKLIGPADRFFASISPERPVERANWTIVEDDDLHHPHARGPLPVMGPADAGEHLWLRVERQTLRRLPRSRDVLFTIRTYLRPLTDVCTDPGVARDMAARVREMPDAMAAYKGIPPMREALLGWLDARALG